MTKHYFLVKSKTDLKTLTKENVVWWSGGGGGVVFSNYNSRLS